MLDNTISKYILKIFLLWRLNLEFWAWAAGRFIPLREGYLGPVPWANFDGVHYLHIAEENYDQFEQAFFPLYPLSIRWLSKLLAGKQLLAALVISNLSLFFALFVLWKLLEKINIQKQTIKWTIVFLLFFPTAFYFGSIYTESLFLLFVLVSFFALVNFKHQFSTVLHTVVKNKKWIMLYLTAAALASATRLVGMFLLVPLGLFTYMYYLWRTVGDPLMFIHSQPAFGAERSGEQIILLPQIFWRYIKIFSTVPISNYDFWIGLLEVVFFIGTLILLWTAWKQRLPKSWILFSAAAVIGPTLTGSLSSMPRYVLVAFPMYIMLADMDKALRYLFFLVCYLLQAVLTVLFIRGYWIS